MNNDIKLNNNNNNNNNEYGTGYGTGSSLKKKSFYLKYENKLVSKYNEPLNTNLKFIYKQKGGLYSDDIVKNIRIN